MSYIDLVLTDSIDVPTIIVSYSRQCVCICEVCIDDVQHMLMRSATVMLWICLHALSSTLMHTHSTCH